METLTAADFQHGSCQGTIFTPDGDLSVSKVMKEFYPSLADLFDGEPTVLPPMPEGAPPEIPRIILQSGSQEWRCEMSPARINLFWRRAKSTTSGIGIEEFFQRASEFLVQYSTETKSRVGRLAGLVTRYAEHESPGQFLARHFCQTRWDRAPLNRPESFELHAHKKFDLASEFQVNSWARSKTGLLKAEDAQKSIVLFEQDLNTLAEEAASRAFGEAEVKRFFCKVATELDIILRLYYPDT
jgi:hypothetical protein